jgi:murein L,D-transpeptidase YafK
MNAYLGAYGKEFDAPGGRKTWEEERKKRILGKSKISVQVSNLDIKINGNKAQARFRQDYDADSLSVNSRKTLELARVDNRWVIVREATGG